MSRLNRDSVGDSTRLRRHLLFLGGAFGTILLLLVPRLATADSVMRADRLLMVGNDPFAYLTQVNALVSTVNGPLDLASFTAFQARDILFVVVMGWLAAVFGGSPPVVEVVLGIYPVVVALLSAGFIYWAGRSLTGERVIGLACVGILAISPVHALRTSLGFADHHAFDQLWLALTLGSLVWLAASTRPTTSRRTLAVAGLLALGVAGQVLSWLGGILFIAPIGLFVIARVLSDVRAGHSPLRTNLGLLLGLGVGSAVVLLVHTAVDWQPTSVALVPGLLTGGLVAVTLVAGWLNRHETRLWQIALSVGLTSIVYTYTVIQLFPVVRELLNRGLSFFGQVHQAREAMSMIAGNYGLITGPYEVLGLVFFVSLPFLVLATSRSVYGHDPPLLAVCVYTWYFLGLSLIQRRFAAELALPLSIIGGLAVLAIAARLRVIQSASPFAGPETRRPARPRLVPDVDDWRVTAFSLCLVIIVTASAIPIAGLTASVEIDDDAYNAARWMDGYADRQGWTYPQDYVFSDWGRNRMYNYVVSGQALTYVYAQEHYFPFLLSTSPGRWYDTLRETPVGFIVTRDGVDLSSNSLHTRLHENLGSDTEDAFGLGRYRALYIGANGSIKVFRLVDGARLTARAEPNTTITLRTNVSTGGPSPPFTYRRTVRVTADGWYAVRVPYAGTYRTKNSTTTAVTDPDVTSGRIVTTRSVPAHWTFDTSQYELFFDTDGGNHAENHGGVSVRGIRGDALRVGASEFAVVPNASALNGSDGFTLSVWFRTLDDTNYTADHTLPRLVSNAPSGPEGIVGYQLMVHQGRIHAGLGNGSTSVRMWGPRVDDGRWHHAALTWDGQTGTLFLDGRAVANESVATTLPVQSRLAIGRTPTNTNPFPGFIDEIRFDPDRASGTHLTERFEQGRRSCLERFDADTCPEPTNTTAT